MNTKRYEKNRPSTAIIYVRVSSEEQVKNYSLADQEKACRAYAKRNEWAVLKLFREEGESAKFSNRTQMNLMKDYVQQNQGKVGYLIVFRADRFSRKTLDHALLRKFFQDYGVLLRSATEPIDETPYGRFFELIASGIANLDNDMRSERTVIGMRSKALDGYWPMGAPWGYKNIEDTTLGKKIIIPDANRAHIVKFLFEEYSRGTYSFKGLAKIVNEMDDVRSGRLKRMSEQLVYRILKNPIHYGWIEIPKFDISIAGRHKPIISRELHAEVQGVMLGGKARKQLRNRNNYDFPLRGVECAECRRHITGGWVRGKMGKLYAYYSCYSSGCSHKSKCIRKFDLEDDFTKFLTKQTPDEKMLDALSEAIAIVHEKTSTESTLESSRIGKRLEKIQKDLDELLKMRVNGVLDDEEYLRQSEKWKMEARELETKRSSLMNPQTSTMAAVEFGIRLIKELPTCWSRLEVGELRVLLQILFPQNLEYQYPGFQTRELSPIYALKSSKTDDLNRQVALRGIEPRLSA